MTWKMELSQGWDMLMLAWQADLRLTACAAVVAFVLAKRASIRAAAFISLLTAAGLAEDLYRTHLLSFSWFLGTLRVKPLMWAPVAAAMAFWPIGLKTAGPEVREEERERRQAVMERLPFFRRA